MTKLEELKAAYDAAYAAWADANADDADMNVSSKPSLLGSISSGVMRALKEGAKVLDIPSNTIYDIKKKKFYRVRNKETIETIEDIIYDIDGEFAGDTEGAISTTKGHLISPKAVEAATNAWNELPLNSNKIGKKMRALIKSNPKDIRLPNNQVIDLDTMTFEPKSKYFSKGSSTIKASMEKKGFVREPNNMFIYQEKKSSGFAGLQSLFHQPKRGNQGASVYQQYNYMTDAPTDIEQFSADILNAYAVDFSDADKGRISHKVLLSFGTPAEFRLFPLEDIDNLEYMITAFQEQTESGWGGSDMKDLSGESIVSLTNLNLDFFRIILTGVSGGGSRNNNEKGNARWWFLDQPKTTNNECLEGAIKRGLDLKERTHTMRKMMCDCGWGINIGEKISLDKIKFYEDAWEVNIEIYQDIPHIKDGIENSNLFQFGSGEYEKTLKILLKDEHYSLIKSPKKRMKEITRPDCRIMGYDRDGNKSVLKMIKEVELKEKGGDPKKLREVAVIFDNETIFDKFDDNFLKVYGVSWFLWDFKNEFNYEDGWNEDRTDNMYHNEPYCYYKRGENCIDELIRFLLNPPEGIVYRPMGFNNSRFDNYSFCESAMKFKVLEDLFLADGSILYTRIRGIKNVWDSSRFLIGSLDSCCKNYGTNPKKMPDLINHYEVQCYYELNGWKGLNELLDSRKELVLYNKIDCICLCDLVGKMRNAYLELFSEDVFESLTISSMGYKICCDKWSGIKDKTRGLIKSLGIEEGEELSEADTKWVAEQLKGVKPKHNIFKAINYDDDSFHRRSICAGRTQSFHGKLDISMDLAMVDVKSLYPTIMGSYADECDMPYGRYFDTGNYIPNRVGIYYVDIIHQRCLWKGSDKVMEAYKKINDITGKNLATIYAPNVIAKRSDDAPLDWFWKGEIKGIVLTSVDIEMLRWATEDEDCVKVYGGHYWKETKLDLFTDFLEPAKIEKTLQDKYKEEGNPLYNQAKREGCKMVSNSLSGKMLEEIHENVGAIFNVNNYREMEEDEKISELNIQDFGCGFSLISGKKSAKDVFNDMKRDKRKPAYLGMFIYSYSRKLMYEKLLSRYAIFYMDTDSACMPMFEWERCKNENKDNGLIETGEYGCLEEEVCYTDKETKQFYPANRLIAISPKNYAVLNDAKEFMSKRKFKGVRKTDVWLPLSYFGDYSKNENGKLIGSAIDRIRGNKDLGMEKMCQEDIRRMREFNCCLKCINMVIDKGEICVRCEAQKKLMKKSYSTEMFEELVNGRKIVVFCSMINRIKYRVGDVNSSKYIEDLGNELSVEEMEVMCGEENETTPMEYTISHRNIGLWEEAKKKFKIQNPHMKEKDLKEEFVGFFQRFRKIRNEKEITNIFKLKQSYMIKII